ncbi:hypothetical protein, partial [Phaeobacter sp. 11ANDIMAR09]|uniref:hypothetical protein n=1 Tax=Phaeobacter sp. 11ANDIMAR09 TaxID=1225647 RepID=UPI001C0F5A3F
FRGAGQAQHPHQREIKYLGTVLRSLHLLQRDRLANSPLHASKPLLLLVLWQVHLVDCAARLIQPYLIPSN